MHTRQQGRELCALSDNPAVIDSALNILACAISPLYGIRLIDYYRPEEA